MTCGSNCWPRPTTGHGFRCESEALTAYIATQARQDVQAEIVGLLCPDAGHASSAGVLHVVHRQHSPHRSARSPSEVSAQVLPCSGHPPRTLGPRPVLPRARAGRAPVDGRPFALPLVVRRKCRRHGGRGRSRWTMALPLSMRATGSSPCPTAAGCSSPCAPSGRLAKGDECLGFFGIDMP